jgi:hypothetical protein
MRDCDGGSVVQVHAVVEVAAIVEQDLGKMLLLFLSLMLLLYLTCRVSKRMLLITHCCSTNIFNVLVMLIAAATHSHLIQVR